MESVLSRLASRSVGHASALSLENDIVDASGYCDTQLVCLDDLSLSAASETDQIVGVVEGQDSLDGILDNFVSIHEDKEITPEAAQQLAVSVEAFFRASGVYVPGGQWTPSFESSVRYSAELKDTRKSSGQKIADWLVEALKRIMDLIRRWWGQLSTSVSSVEKYIDAVSAKAHALQGGPRSKELIKVGASANFLTDRHGVIAKPEKQLVESDTRYHDFLHEWFAMFDKDKHVLKYLPDLSKFKVEFVVGRVLEIVPGTGVGLLNGAKIKISQSVKAGNSDAAILTLSEMHQALASAKDALASFKKFDQDIERIDKLSKEAAKEASEFSKSYSDSTQGKAFSERARALSKAFQLCSNGLTQTAPYYLKTIRACVEYVAICTRRYETPKAG